MCALPLRASRGAAKALRGGPLSAPHPRATPNLQQHMGRAQFPKPPWGGGGLGQTAMPEGKTARVNLGSGLRLTGA